MSSCCDRRAFLRLGVSTAAGLVLASWGFSQDAGPFRGLKIGMHTYTLRKLSFEEAVRVTKEAGVRHIGFNPVHLPLDLPIEKLDQAREFVKNAGLTLMAVGVIGFDGKEPEARRAFEYAKRMGMPTIVANPERKALDLLDDLVAEYDIRIAIHNHGPDSLYSTPDDVLRAVENHDPRIGACADIGHYERSNVRAADALRALKDRLYDIHLKDVDKPEKSGRSVVLGKGIIDFRAVFDTLLELQFAHHVALEYEDQPDNPVPGVLECYAYARKLLA